MAPQFRPSQPVFFFFFSSYGAGLLCLGLLVAGPAPAAASKGFLQKTCNSVLSKDECNTYLLDAAWALRCDNVTCLARGIIIQLTMPKMMAVRDNIELLADREQASEQRRALLTACVDHYNEGLASLGGMMKNAYYGRFDDAVRFGDVESPVHHCENSFTTKPTPVTSKNDEVFSVLYLSVQIFVITGQPVNEPMWSG